MMDRFRAVLCAVVVGSVALTVGCSGRRPAPPAGLNEVQTAGWQAYVDLNCASCHGENRKGQRSGPELTGLAEHWTADRLVAYLTDPDAVVQATPRLAYKAERYSIGMPSASAKSPGYAAKARAEKLEALAEYLLIDP